MNKHDVLTFAASSLVSLALVLPLRSQEATEYELPPAHRVLEAPPAERADLPRVLRALPLSLDAVSVAYVGTKKVLYLPVVMDEPRLPVDVEALTLDPMDWGEQRVASRKLGRRSLYFVEPGRSMLYGVVIDPTDMRPADVGVGLVVVRRIDEETYDVLIQSNGREVLAAARGKLDELDPSVGHGTLRPAPDQARVREKYDAAWGLAPCSGGDAYPLFSCRGRSD